jgi:hypothetical protein
MIKSKLIDTLKSFTKQELKELSDLVESPYYNRNKNVTKMFTELKKYYPDFGNRNMTKENVYAKIFPGKKYADKTFRNLASDVIRLTEKYLIAQSLEKDKLLEKRLLISSLTKKNLFSPAEHAIREADKLYDVSLFDGGNTYFTKHLIEMEKDFLEISRNNLITLNMKEGEYIIYTFLSKYMLFKMKLYNYRHKLSTQATSAFIEEFEKRVNLDDWMKYMERSGGGSGNSSAEEIILIYYCTTKFMGDLSDDNSFNKALALFYKNKPMIDKTETVNLYITFTGFCAVKMSKGAKEYTETLFELYKRMFEENLVIGENEKYLHITIFNNVVTTALMLRKMEWTKTFIEKYTPMLLPEYRDTIYNYSYAWYYFSAGEYEKSLEHLSKVNHENYWIKARSRILQLRLYYELNHVESFFSFHDSLKHSLKTNKELPASGKENDYTFVSLLGRLARIKFAVGDQSGIDKLRANLEEEARQNLKGQLREWVLLKIKEINVKTSTF